MNRSSDDTTGDGAALGLRHPLRRAVFGVLDLGGIVAGILVVLVAVGVIANIASRNLVGASIVWVLEFSEYALVAMALLGGGIALAHRRHTNMDIVLRLVPARVARLLLRTGDLLLVVIMAVMSWYAVLAVLRSRASGAMLYKFVVFPEWWLMLLLPVGMVAMLGASLLNLLSPIPQDPDAGADTAAH